MSSLGSTRNLSPVPSIAPYPGRTSLIIARTVKVPNEFIYYVDILERPYKRDLETDTVSSPSWKLAISIAGE